MFYDGYEHVIVGRGICWQSPDLWDWLVDRYNTEIAGNRGWRQLTWSDVIEAAKQIQFCSCSLGQVKNFLFCVVFILLISVLFFIFYYLVNDIIYIYIYRFIATVLNRSFRLYPNVHKPISKCLWDPPPIHTMMM